MTVAEKYIVDTYSTLFVGLNSASKVELFEKLAKSLKQERKSTDKEFFESFGAFGSKKSAEEISKNIKESRNFNQQDLKL